MKVKVDLYYNGEDTEPAATICLEADTENDLIQKVCDAMREEYNRASWNPEDLG